MIVLLNGTASLAGTVAGLVDRTKALYKSICFVIK